MAEHNELGESGEALAAYYLKKKGYAILNTNWHYSRYELDIIAQYRGELVIVEVKTRSSDCLQLPETAITPRKIRHLVAAADTYVKQHKITLPVRFDVLIVIEQAGEKKVEHIEDAFYPPVW